MSTLECGSIVGGKYRLVRPLGAGGMEAVYEAEHCLSLSPAAIKWLDGGADEQHLLRMLRAARAAATVRHPNVVEILDVMREDRAILLVMEVLLGEPLSALLGRDAPTLHELARLLLPAMHGAAAAHAVGVVHGAITPSHVFLAQRPGFGAPLPKLIDFGLEDPASAALPTEALAYLAPEQLLGGLAVDGRADVYAFGVILYESLVGAPPFGAGQHLDEQAAHLTLRTATAPRTLRREIPEALEALVMRAIARDPTERVPTMNDFIRALEPFARYEPYGAPLRSFAPRRRSLGSPSSAPTQLRGSWPVRAPRGRTVAVAALTLSLGLGALVLRYAVGREDLARMPRPSATPAAVFEPESAPVSRPAGALPTTPHADRDEGLALGTSHEARAGESDGGPTRPAHDDHPKAAESALPHARSPRRSPH